LPFAFDSGVSAIAFVTVILKKLFAPTLEVAELEIREVAELVEVEAEETLRANVVVEEAWEFVEENDVEFNDIEAAVVAEVEVATVCEDDVVERVLEVFGISAKYVPSPATTITTSRTTTIRIALIPIVDLSLV
jgi:hypothetical protein